ncbi:hypothetical protein TVAG_012890 [Trichomonas vaginalis G3]|uniref:Importin N-terminal domain-containing protein n=2 Tax=Trichomonas vaginalis (strain ATCC PRA-98 / G3) TaxID=412133 RepID=A2GDT6_TRIV3|nr:armadillo (ARM) repeat-containing protein family [Trichomonas vaginalis G3]EAX84678.1 hypothetical protein TVAG_012890 [Trichomonas vaginalis G3]KAI5546812.1 armadillo (ARM) repeat-containing protein family [Trichomonas vaginalis G3]|eukprot:XP_001297608.1 hypothetical protein [Trichomonas vaginalis G3]
MIGNSNALPGVFYLWKDLICFPVIYENYGSYIMETLLPIAFHAFQGESSDVRISSLEFVITSIHNLIEFLEIDGETLNNICTMVINVADFEIKQSVQEATSYFNNLYTCIEECFDAQEPLLPLVFKVCAYIQDTDIPIEIRRNSVQILTIFINMQPENLGEGLEEIIQAVVNFSLELAQENQDEGGYKDTSLFFIEAVKAIEDIMHNSIQFLMPIFSSLFTAQDEQSFLVLLMISTAITSDSPTTVVEMYSDLEAVVVSCLQSEISYLIDAALDFLKELVENSPSIAVHIQEKFEEYFLQMAENENVLQILATIYNYSEIPPANPQQSLEILLQQFSSSSSYHHELAFAAISSLIKNLRDLPEGLYATVKPIIDELVISGTGAIGSALKGFAAFALADPTTVTEDLENMVKVVLEALKVKDNELINSALLTAIELFQLFPISIANYAQPFFEEGTRIAGMLARMENDEEEDFIEEEDQGMDLMNQDDDEEKYEKYYAQVCEKSGHAFQLISLIFKNYPQQFTDHADEIIDIWRGLDDNENPLALLYVYCSLPDLIFGLNKNGQDISDVFTTVIENFASKDDQDINVKLWDCIGYVIRISNAEIASQYAQKIFVNIVGILSCSQSIYLRQNEKGRLEPIFIKPIMNAITELFVKLGRTVSEIVLQIGEDGQAITTPCLDALIPYLQNICKDKNPIVRSSAINTLSFISSYFPENTELMSSICELAEKDLDVNYNDVKINLFQAFNFLVWANKELVAPRANTLVNLAMEMIKNEEINETTKFDPAVLWASLIELYELSPSMEELEAVINVLPGCAHDYQLKYSAHFASFLMQKYPNAIQGEPIVRFATTIIGSDDALFEYIDPNDIVLLAQAINSADPELVKTIANNNESQLQYIKEHMEIIANFQQ